MAAEPDLIAGTITLTNGSEEFTGIGTSWLLSGGRAGDTIIDLPGTPYQGVVKEITSNTAGLLTKPWDGPTLTSAFRYRFQPDGSRVPAEARNLIELLGNGNLQAMAGLTGSASTFAMFTGPGAMTLVPKTDLVSGAAYNVQIANLAARAAYDGMPGPVGNTPGFAVLVANVGDGRSAIYSKASDASADWTDPAYVTGSAITLDVTDVGEVPYGTPPDVTLTPVAGGYTLKFDIPAGMIIEPGTTTTLAADQDAEVTFVPVTGGYRIDIALPRGPAGDIDGVTTFWQGRITIDTDAAAARLGLGAGVVDGIAEGTGIAVDTTDPTAPEISVVLAEEADAEAGTGTGIMTAELTAAAIAALSPPTDTSDLEFIVAQLAMQVADNSNIALFLGPNGNGFVDSFDTLTNVDVGSGTNLDTSTAGVLKPTLAASALIPAATGTIIGNFDTRQSAAFDGTTSQVVTASALKSGALSGYVGKDYSASPKTISSARTFGSSDSGYASVTTTTINLRAKNGSAPSSASDGTLLGTTGAFADVEATNQKDIASSNVGPWDYVWFEFLMGASSPIVLAEGQFFAPPVVNNLTVRSAAFTAAVVPTKMKALINVKEVEAATAGTDYTLECSRDGGTTWALMTLTERAIQPTGLRVVEAAETDVSGQPSGTAPRWRFKALKNIELHDVYFLWS